MSVSSAWTGPPALAHYAWNEWDTCPAWLGLASPAHIACYQALIEYFTNISSLCNVSKTGQDRLAQSGEHPSTNPGI